MFGEDNKLWVLSETLAKNNFQDLIEETEQSESIDELKLRACAFGTLKKQEKYLMIWQQILEKDEDVELKRLKTKPLSKVNVLILAFDCNGYKVSRGRHRI